MLIATLSKDDSPTFRKGVIEVSRQTIVTKLNGARKDLEECPESIPQTCAMLEDRIARLENELAAFDQQYPPEDAT